MSLVGRSPARPGGPPDPFEAGRPAHARPVFKLYGHEGRLRLEHPDCGHDFPPEMREAAYRLFDAVLAGK